MAASWFQTTVGEQITLQRGFDITKAQQRDGMVPVVSSGGVGSYHDTPAATGPGVVIGRKGVVGSVFYIRQDYWPHDTTLWVKDFHGNDRRYVYYFLQSLIPTLKSLDVGSANPTLNRNHVHPIVVMWPQGPEQRAVATILSSFDDKIELNRKMSATLEAMARTLFKSWFVDFDPVRAKAEGRDPGLPPEIAALFPDSFEESELGGIPKGWRVLALDEIARFLNGLALQKYPPVNRRSLPVIKIAQLRAGDTTGADMASADLDRNYVVGDGDVLFSWSGSLECVLWTGGTGALNQHLFKVTSALFPKWLYYLWIHRHLDDFRHIAAGKATTMGHIQRHHLSDAKTVIPPANTLKSAGSALSPLLERVAAARLESRTLAHIRDTMLPKLISGEIRVADAERVVAKSA